MKHSIALLVENRPGVLTHVSAQISRRGFNIETIAASSTEAPDITRISIVLEVASQEELEQIVAQLEKLIRVVKVIDLTQKERIARELALVKVRAIAASRAEITNLCEIFRAKIVDVHPETVTIELTGEGDKIDAFCDLMSKHGIVEIIRTGEIFLSRDSKAARDLIEG